MSYSGVDYTHVLPKPIEMAPEKEEKKEKNEKSKKEKEKKAKKGKKDKKKEKIIHGDKILVSSKEPIYAGKLPAQRFNIPAHHEYQNVSEEQKRQLIQESQKNNENLRRFGDTNQLKVCFIFLTLENCS